jgi:hypothetical protein
MHMRMVGHRRAPAVEHGGDADAGVEMLWIGGNGEQCLRRCAEQQVVDHRLILVRDRGDLGRQGEDQVEIANRQQVNLAGGEPVLRRRAVALWTKAVAAGIVSNPAVTAILAALDMAAERQHSMADITLSRPRLRCPGIALAADRRHFLPGGDWFNQLYPETRGDPSFSIASDARGFPPDPIRKGEGLAE